MSPKIEIAALLLLTLVPVWLAMVAVDLTRRGIAAGVAILLVAGACFWFSGFEASLAMTCAAYVLYVAWLVTKIVITRIRRWRLLENSRPERSDLERWARRALRRDAWKVEVRTGPLRLIARRSGCAELHVFCCASYEKLGPPDIRDLARYASRVRHPVVILLFGAAPAILVDTLRRSQLLPVSPRDFPALAALAGSREAFVLACRAAAIEEVPRRPRLFAEAEPSLA